MVFLVQCRAGGGAVLALLLLLLHRVAAAHARARLSGQLQPVRPDLRLAAPAPRTAGSGTGGQPSFHEGIKFVKPDVISGPGDEHEDVRQHDVHHSRLPVCSLHRAAVRPAGPQVAAGAPLPRPRHHRPAAAPLCLLGPLARAGHACGEHLGSLRWRRCYRVSAQLQASQTNICTEHLG